MMAREPGGRPPDAPADAARGLRELLPLLPATTVLAVLFGGAVTGALSRTDAATWRAALGDPRFWPALGFTLRVTVLATVLSAVLAVGLAALVRRRPRAAAVVGVPVLVPHLVAATVAAAWLGPGGLADRLLGDLAVELVRDRAGVGIVLVTTWKEAPFLTLLVLTAWDEGVRRREEAAATLGAGRWDRFRHAAWPAVRTPLAVGSLVVGAFVVGSFEVPLVVGPTSPPMLATLALQQTRVASLEGTAVAAVTLLVATALALLPAVAAARWARRADA